VTFDEVVDRVVALVRDLAPGYGTSMPTITRVGGWGLLAGDLATALAMVASELLHNAVEHAHAQTITVELSRDEAALQMVVRDDGAGLPEGFDPAVAGLGLGIVQSLVTGDLQGDWTMTGSAEGTTVVVRVPL
jgi:two-component sensor histidine kinase